MKQITMTSLATRIDYGAPGTTDKIVRNGLVPYQKAIGAEATHASIVRLVNHHVQSAGYYHTVGRHMVLNPLIQASQKAKSIQTSNQHTHY